uniref:Uncharacterized protein n=1 Tax=Cacopsylla melanoneura TaxID=428564 RepID=A0A8D9FEI4_9HEMI
MRRKLLIVYYVQVQDKSFPLLICPFFPPLQLTPFLPPHLSQEWETKNPFACVFHSTSIYFLVYPMGGVVQVSRENTTKLLMGINYLEKVGIMYNIMYVEKI